MQQLHDKLAVVEHTTKAEVQLKEKYQKQFRVLEERLKTSNDNSRICLEGRTIGNGSSRRQSLGGVENFSKSSSNGYLSKRTSNSQYGLSRSNSASTLLKHVKSSSGPHKIKGVPGIDPYLANKLKYVLTYREIIAILMQHRVLVDGKFRTDKTYLAGFMDVVSIPKSNENFRLLCDTKGRFCLHSIRDEEAKFKLCKVCSVQFGQKGGRNRGRVGDIKNREKCKATFETGHTQDATGHEFATRLGNVFTIGTGTKPWVSLPNGKGIKLTIIEEARKRLGAQTVSTA
ncbi:hypothetical protein SO802_032092 [Lithocarpus litseifolius]|uniref:40S ribosomal protein S4 n=1 Tax=Lithocarpus litseifolius TaxID=425828 RepID=A0AAW2BME5_9ROSI